MRQLLGRKSKQKLFEDQDSHHPSTVSGPPPTHLPALPSERVLHRLNQNQDQLGLLSGGNSGVTKLDTKRTDRISNLALDNGHTRTSNRPTTNGSERVGRPPANANNGLLPSPTSYGSRAPSSTRSDNGTRRSDEQRKVTDRFQQVVPSKTGPPRVLAPTDPDRVSYRRCEDEPLHTPGAIQSFGALIGLRYSNSGHLEVRIASENTRKVLGYGPEQLFGCSSFLDILKQDFHDELIARINYALRDVEGTQEETRLDVFKMVLTFPYEPDVPLWCAIHLAPGHENLVICEFEDHKEACYLNDIEAAKILPVQPVHVMGADVSAADLERSTKAASKPLPVFEIARMRKNKEFSQQDIFNAMCQAERQFAQCKSLQELLEVAVGIVTDVTGFHRAMFYRFDSRMNGRVDAEMLNPQASTDVYRGLQFPASDIPKQAQKLYKINRIRLLHDRDATTSRLVCRNVSDFEGPLDLTHAYLRAFSPVHCKYLVNLGVKSTMSISIIVNGDLWGLIACHGYGDAGVRVSLPIRELCRNIGESVAMNVQRLLVQERLEARRAPSTPVPNAANLSANRSNELLKLVDADFAFLSVGDKPRPIGKVEPYGEAVAIMLYLQSCRYNTTRCSHNIKADFPGLSYPPGIHKIAGLLFIPLNVGEGNDFFVFFRKSRTIDVHWAGNPHKKSFKPGSEYLEPRGSFQRWSETVSGTSEDWTEDHLDTARVLGMMYERFVDVWPQKPSPGAHQLASIHSSTEEAATRFKAVVGCVEMALEHNIDDKARQVLVQAEQASTSLMHMMDNILKLTETVDGSDPPSRTFNLHQTASNVMEDLKAEAQRNDLDLSVHVSPLPATVKGDGNRFTQLLVYFTNNAFKRSSSASVVIVRIRTENGTSIIRLSIQDTGPVMSETELDDTFREFEQAQDESNWPLLNQQAPTFLNEASGGHNVHLANIARYVRDINGHVEVASEFGTGSTFTIELAFEHAYSSPPRKQTRKLRTVLGFPNTTPSNIKVVHSPQMPPRSPRDGNAMMLKAGPQTLRPLKQDLSTARLSAMGPGLTNDGKGQYEPVISNVLVAETNPSTLRMLDERLSSWGHFVNIASDGQEAHEHFAGNPGKVDVVLMDIEMAKGDGVLSARMIRFSEKAGLHSGEEKRVPIIALTSSMSQDSSFEYVQNGFDGLIVKPIDLRRLDIMLQGVKNPRLKRQALFNPGQWDKGGWLSL